MSEKKSKSTQEKTKSPNAQSKPPHEKSKPPQGNAVCRGENITGQRFGKLTVLEYAGRRGRVHFWKCKCDCGNITTVCKSNLKNGHTTSCGCLVKPFASRTMVDGTCIEIIRSKKIFKSNTSGVRGVYPLKNGKWAAHIQFKGKRTYLGAFDTVEQAAQVRRRAEIIYEQFLRQYDSGEMDDAVKAS